MSNLGRQPLTIVEIDLPLCTRVWGVGACTAVLSAAAPRKCFNTLATCAVPSAYNATTQTLRFAYNQSGLPKGQTVFPALQSVSTRSGEINLSGIDPRTNALGKRARVTVTLQDFTYHDTLTDPYVAERSTGAAQFSGVGYDPARGTFFAKLIARQPYYVGKALRVKRGQVGDDLATMPTAHYVITEWSGPDAAGVVQITAKDVLDLADNAKAVAPKASRGKLLAAITADATSLTLSPEGVGAEYPASGRLAVGREVVTYTRSGDVLTLTARGVDNTTPVAHSVNDVAQVCLRYDAARPCDVIRDLLVTYAGVPAAFIDLTAWQDENDRWLPSIKMTATITKPAGVAQLIGEVCQHGLLTWWDETAQQIRYRANRPLEFGETAYPLGDAANIITGTPDIERADDQRISEIHFWHAVIDPTEGAESERNYSKLVIAPVTPNPYGQDAIKTIYSRWFGQSGDDPAAASIAVKLRNRYQFTPNIISGDVDLKDAPGLSLGNVVEVTSYLLQDATGANLPEQMQLKYLEKKDGRLSFKAETYRFTGRYGLVAPSSTADYSAATAARKLLGTWAVSASTLQFPDGTGPYVAY
jgi:hypothetical protein